MRHFSNIYELSKIILEEAICIEKTGVILAGGKNSRMGRDKAFLELHDKLFIEIAIEAFKKYGVIKGMFLTIKRILKCHPFHPGGYDPLK